MNPTLAQGAASRRPRPPAAAQACCPWQHAGCIMKLGKMILVGQFRLKLASLWLLLNYNLNLKEKI